MSLVEKRNFVKIVEKKKELNGTAELRNFETCLKKMKMHSFYVFSSLPFLLEKLLGELKLVVLVV